MKAFSHHFQLAARIGGILAILIALVAPLPTSAAQITGRSLTLSNSNGGATGVTYTFNFTLPTTGTAIQSVDIDICTSTAGGSCTPSGFVNSSSTLASQPTGLGAASGWTVSTATAGHLRLSDASNSTDPSGSQTITFGNVTNPTATNTTFYALITTYSGSNWSTGPLDTGTVAASTATQIQLTGTMAEALTFCTGTSITGQNCGTISGSTVALGNFSTSAATTGTSVMAASTNGASGYAITVSGSPPICSGCAGTPSIAAMGTQSANGSATTSSVGTAQFGMNLVNNTSPSGGAAVSGSGSGTYGTNYGTQNNFRFYTGDTVATAAAATNANTFTVDYLVNVPGSQAAGAYTANFTYICTATF
ncbi:MAG TPA: hypothetical protein VMR75_00455 [Candidatus Saccharimonadales bacterium]|nr:hypothetical protein [Candidatus Saccharimonadales bacterium]